MDAGDSVTIHPDGTVENGFLGLQWKKTETTSGAWSKLSDGFLFESGVYGYGVPMITLVPNAAAQRTIDWVEAEWDRLQDDVLHGLQFVLAIASMLPMPGVSTALGLINLGISYARGHEITTLDLVAAAAPGIGGVAKLAKLGARMAKVGKAVSKIESATPVVGRTLNRGLQVRDNYQQAEGAIGAVIEGDPKAIGMSIFGAVMGARGGSGGMRNKLGGSRLTTASGRNISGVKPKGSDKLEAMKRAAGDGRMQIANHGTQNQNNKNSQLTDSIGQLRKDGKKDAHHVYQDAAVRDLPGYDTNAAPGAQVPGPANRNGTPHNKATAIQRESGGGTLVS
jgi:hypothetical protein